MFYQFEGVEIGDKVVANLEDGRILSGVVCTKHAASDTLMDNFSQITLEPDFILLESGPDAWEELKVDSVEILARAV